MYKVTIIVNIFSLTERTEAKIENTNLCLLAPHVQVLALGFGEMVPCLLFGSSVEYRHNLLNCGRGTRGASMYRPKKDRERGRLGRSRGVGEKKTGVR